MKRILLVDDDPLILKVYQEGLSRQGFQVETAADGVEALRSVRRNRPDLMVLDLMMPKFSGVEVLKFLRAEPELSSLPVVVLSNSYMSELAQQAAMYGAEKGVLKATCSPRVLGQVIHEMVSGLPVSLDPTQLIAVPSPKSQVQPIGASDGTMKAPPPVPVQQVPNAAEVEALARARKDLVSKSGETGLALRQLFQAFSTASQPQEREERWRDLYRKVHLLTVSSGMAHFQSLGQMSSAVEALFFGMMNKLEALTPSMLRTSAMAVDLLEAALARLGQEAPSSAPPAMVLVVSDNAASLRSMVSALTQAELRVRSTQNPITALQWLQESKYELLVVDLEKTELDGFEFCRRVRATPGYRRTPLIYLSNKDDFETRSKSALAGGSDLMTKPVSPAELVVRSFMLLIKHEE